ncbi:AAA family ATPase [Paenibacillus pabuli]|uniref:AAA family ATPase n=1 Tax=Paenibacillus pabuli TaxID=1472 RepID=UPI003CE7BA86
MSRLLIRKLQIDDYNSIIFNEKVNYVVGDNGSGKTTLFNLIQYILGLTSTKRLSFLRTSAKPYLVCEFKSKKVRISRNLDSNIINFEGDITTKVKANSLELNKLYSELLEISFINSYEYKPTLDILNFSFYSDLDFKKNNDRARIYNKILGYNSDYLDSIEKDITKFETQIYTDKQSLELVEQYKMAVNKSLENLDTDNSIFSNILNSEFEKMKFQELTNYELLNHAQHAYKEELKMSRIYIEEKLSMIEPFYNEIMKDINLRLGKVSNIDLKSIFDKKDYRSISFGEKSLMLFCLQLTFCTDYKDLTNGLGLLVTDDMLTVNDNYFENRAYEKLVEISQKGELQYIGFTSKSSNIAKEHIVFDISPWQGVKLFER